LVVQRTKVTVDGAVREFEKAVAADPDYALAHAELAIAIFLQNRDQYGDLTTTETTARGAPHARRAMDLDPTLAEPHAAIGNLLWNQLKPEEALAQFRQAIQINPNYSIIYTWMGTLLANDLGRYTEAFEIRKKALRIDPLSIPAIANYVIALTDRNRFVEAKHELEKLVSIAPGFYAIYQGSFASHGGKWANAVLADLDALKVAPDSGWPRNQLTWHFAAIGLENEALVISKAPEPGVLQWLGKPDAAIAVAEVRLVEEPSSLARRDLGLALAGAGDYQRAQAILEELWQLSGGLIAGDFSQIQLGHAAALIDMRRAAGQEAEVGELVAAIRDDVRRRREAGMTRADQFLSVDFAEGLAAYLAGEHDTGLVLIAKASEEGFFIPQSEAYLKVLYDDPGFAPIRASQEARQARERKKFLDIVCIDNPYAGFWQPEDGTCERYATAGT
jgi:tetratricopeptide (TPR) repeat protein